MSGILLIIIILQNFEILLNLMIVSNLFFPASRVFSSSLIEVCCRDNKVFTFQKNTPLSLSPSLSPLSFDKNPLSLKKYSPHWLTGSGSPGGSICWSLVVLYILQKKHSWNYTENLVDKLIIFNHFNWYSILRLCSLFFPYNLTNTTI